MGMASVRKAQKYRSGLALETAFVDALEGRKGRSDAGRSPSQLRPVGMVCKNTNRGGSLWKGPVYGNLDVSSSEKAEPRIPFEV